MARGAVVCFRWRETAFTDRDVVGAPDGVLGQDSGHFALTSPDESGVQGVEHSGGIPGGVTMEDPDG